MSFSVQFGTIYRTLECRDEVGVLFFCYERSFEREQYFLQADALDENIEEIVLNEANKSTIEDALQKAVEFLERDGSWVEVIRTDRGQSATEEELREVIDMKMREVAASMGVPKVKYKVTFETVDEIRGKTSFLRRIVESIKRVAKRLFCRK